MKTEACTEAQEMEDPRIFLQFKNTDICYDFYCECGEQGHFDGYFGNPIECVHCGRRYMIPHFIGVLPMTEEDQKRWQGHFAKPKDDD